MRIAFLWGLMKVLWDFLRPLLLSEVGRFLADQRVHDLAMRAVERATFVDLDNDGKYDHAFNELYEDLKTLGIEYYRGWVAMAVEAAYRRLPAARR